MYIVYICIYKKKWYKHKIIIIIPFSQSQIFTWFSTNRRSTIGNTHSITSSCSTGWKITTALARGSWTNNFQFSTKVKFYLTILEGMYVCICVSICFHILLCIFVAIYIAIKSNWRAPGKNIICHIFFSFWLFNFFL